MTVIASIGARRYNPNQKLATDFNVDPNATLVQVTLTHANTLADWPDINPLYQFDWDWGNGSTGANQGRGGLRLDKQGNVIAGDVSVTFSVNKPLGITAGRVDVTLFDAVRTAVLVESF